MNKIIEILFVAVGVILIRLSNIDNYILNVIGGTIGALCILFPYRKTP